MDKITYSKRSLEQRMVLVKISLFFIFNFNHASDIGNLTRQMWSFSKLNRLESGEPLEPTFLSSLIIVKFKANLV